MSHKFPDKKPSGVSKPPPPSAPPAPKRKIDAYELVALLQEAQKIFAYLEAPLENPSTNEHRERNHRRIWYAAVCGTLEDMGVSEP